MVVVEDMAVMVDMVVWEVEAVVDMEAMEEMEADIQHIHRMDLEGEEAIYLILWLLEGEDISELLIRLAVVDMEIIH